MNVVLHIIDADWSGLTPSMTSRLCLVNCVNVYNSEPSKPLKLCSHCLLTTLLCYTMGNTYYLILTHLLGSGH